MNVEIVRSGSPLPRIAKARALDGRKVEITWSGGTKKVVDLMPALASRRIYLPLRSDDLLFRTLRVSEYGDAIEWDNDLGLSAIWIDSMVPADFENADFRNAMDTLELSLEGMAAALEVSRRQIADYRKDKPIPRHIALATRYLVEHGQKARKAG
jgi:hypothetical protein